MHIDPKENMNPADEIKALKEKRDALESQLVVGMDKEERHDINQRIIAIDDVGWSSSPTDQQVANVGSCCGDVDFGHSPWVSWLGAMASQHLRQCTRQIALEVHVATACST